MRDYTNPSLKDQIVPLYDGGWREIRDGITERVKFEVQGHLWRGQNTSWFGVQINIREQLLNNLSYEPT